MLPHRSTNFEIESYYQNKQPFIGVYSRNYLPNKTSCNIFYYYYRSILVLKLPGIMFSLCVS